MSGVVPFQSPESTPITVDQYHRLIVSGVLTEYDRVELINGCLVRKPTKSPAHEFAAGQLEQRLRDRIPSGWHVRNQAPVTLSSSEPEPDLSVVHGHWSDYRSRHPFPDDTALVLEVSDSSLGTDRWKGAAYGAAGIAVYWIVNLPDRCIEVYARPSDAEESGYEACDVLHEGEDVPVIIDGQDCGTIPVAELLP